MTDLRKRHPRGWRAAKIVTALVLVGIAVRVIADTSGELRSAVEALGHVRLAWVAAAVVTEVLSYVTYGAAQQVLLRSAGQRVGILPLTGVSVVGQAASNCLPGGLAVSAVVMYRQLRRRGVPDALTGWVLLLAALLYGTALATLTVIGVQIAGATNPVPGLRAFSVAVVAVLLIAVAGLWLGRDRVARWRLVTRSDTLRGLAGRLTEVRMSPVAAVTAFVLLMLCWATDALALLISYAAVDVHPPLQGLLLAYCAGQLAASFPITPGGLGIAEGSLTVALVAFGGAKIGTLAAVLLYRLVAFWAIIPSGGAAYLLLRRGERGLAPAAEEAT